MPIWNPYTNTDNSDKTASIQPFQLENESGIDFAIFHEESPKIVAPKTQKSEIIFTGLEDCGHFPTRNRPRGESDKSLIDFDFKFNGVTKRNLNENLTKLDTNTDPVPDSTSVDECSSSVDTGKPSAISGNSLDDDSSQ